MNNLALKASTTTSPTSTTSLVIDTSHLILSAPPSSLSTSTPSILPDKEVNEVTGCTHYALPIIPPSTLFGTLATLTSLNVSAYTSQGKHKAKPCDPISSIQHIQDIKTHFLNHGFIKNRLRNNLLFTLGISVGLRGCDLLELRIKDVLSPQGVIFNEIAAYERKTYKMNYPALNFDAKEAIYLYLSSLKTFTLEDYLFADEDENKATPLKPNSLYKIMKRAGQYLNLPYNLGAHSLRKTFAYWTIKLHPTDVTILNALQDMLNHDSPKTTLRYAGITKEDKRVLYSDISSIFHPDRMTELMGDTSNNINDSELMQAVNMMVSEDDNVG